MKKMMASIWVIWLVWMLAWPVHAQEGIVMESQTLVIHPDDEGMDVHTILHLVNTSSSPQDVGWELPDNLDQLQILVGEPDVIVADKKKMQRKEPLPGNGDFTIVYKYRYPFPKGTKDFMLPFSYPAERLQILLPEENRDMELASTSVQKQGPMDFQGKPYILYLGSKLNAASVNIQVGTPSVPPFHSAFLIQMWSESVFHQVDPHLLTALIVAVSAGAGWLVYRSVPNRKDNREAIVDEEERRFLDLYRQNQILFAKLAELQEKADQGQIGSEEFVQRKALYKEKLVDINLELKQLVS